MQQHLLSEHSRLLTQLVPNTWEAMLWANTVRASCGVT